jgi:hypothetical protein
MGLYNSEFAPRTTHTEITGSATTLLTPEDESVIVYGIILSAIDNITYGTIQLKNEDGTWSTGGIQIGGTSAIGTWVWTTPFLANRGIRVVWVVNPGESHITVFHSQAGA